MGLFALMTAVLLWIMEKQVASLHHQVESEVAPRGPLQLNGLLCLDMDRVLVDHLSTWQVVYDAIGADNSESFNLYNQGKLDEWTWIKLDLRIIEAAFMAMGEPMPPRPLGRHPACGPDDARREPFDSDRARCRLAPW